MFDPRSTFERDWSRPDDYDPDGAEWQNANVVGSAYQLEVDVRRSGHYRYRRVVGCGQWIKGEPPK